MPLPLYAGAVRESGDAPSAPPGRAGKAAVCIMTYGCSHNVSDSEHMAGVLLTQGYALTERPDDAEVIVINSCSVKGPSQESLFSAVRKHRGERHVIVAGCVPQADPRNTGLDGISIVGVQAIGSIGEAVERTMAGERVHMLGKTAVPSLDLPKRRRNSLVEIIPINLGCLGSCTYCKTQHARGRLRSYAPQDIVVRARRAMAEGVKEIWLTSEDSGAYGRDIGTDLPTLLEAVVAELKPDVMLRIGMANPPYILEHLDRIAAVLNHPNVYSFLHVPVQSGSDSVLAAMRREYTVAEFLRVVERMRERVPGITIATDIICGFPSETEDDFAATLGLVRANRFPVVNISQFYPRPGTAAARMRLLPTQEVKCRSTALTRLMREQRPFDGLVGTRQRVWITGTADGQLVGRTKGYVQVFLPYDASLLGSSIEVAVIAAGRHHLKGIPSSL